MRILKDDSLFLLIDVQSRLFPHIHENEKLEQNILKLIKGVHTLELPMLVTEQYTKGLGFTVDSIKNELGESYKPLEKMEFSCCDNDDFADKLKSFGKKNLIIAGIETHVCVLQTVLDAIETGYQPVVIQNCVSSRFPDDKNAALRRIEREGGIVSTYESILFEMARVSGTPQFKAISKIVK